MEGSSFPMTAVALGTLVRGESPSYKKQSSCRSGFSRDHCGIEGNGFGIEGSSFPMTAVALGTLIRGYKKRPLRDRGEGVRDGKLLLPNDRRCPRDASSGRKPLLQKATIAGSRRQGLRCGKPFPQK